MRSNGSAPRTRGPFGSIDSTSLIYPDGVRARLAPAYDYIFTKGYLPEDRLGLNLGGTKDYAAIGPSVVRRFAAKMGRDPDEILEWIRGDVERMHATWRRIGHELPLEPGLRPLLDDHLDATIRRLSSTS